MPGAFFRRLDASLPVEQRYFGGRIPGIRLIENVAVGDFSETPELTLVLDTPQGQVVLVGCSHPGIERILESAGAPAGQWASWSALRRRFGQAFVHAGVRAVIALQTTRARQGMPCIPGHHRRVTDA